MQFARVKEKWLMIVACGLVLLLMAAAIWQYRWINRVTEADKQQRRAGLQIALTGCRDEMAAALGDVMRSFRPVRGVPVNIELEAHLAWHFSGWQHSSGRPELLGAIYLGTMQRGRVTFSRLNPTDGKFTAQPWPESLALFREILEDQEQLPEGASPPFLHEFAFEYADGRPGIIFPLIAMRNRPQHPPFNRPGMPPPPPPPAEAYRGRELRGWCFLELNAEYLSSRFIEETINRFFGPPDVSSYNVAMISGQPPRLLYRSTNALTDDALATIDGGVTILGPEMMPPQPPPPPPPPPRGEESPRADGQPRLPRPDADREARRAPPAPIDLDNNPSPGLSWQLVAKHKAGSLDVAVNQTRLRNLTLSFGILLILTGSIVLFALATGRAHKLAKQQMEFVAGISHELRTPLAVIHSASYNLAQGVVADPRRVQHYGAMIQTEARRLSNQVEQALDFAGIQSGRKPYHFQPTQILPVVERARAEYATVFDEAGWLVEYDAQDNLPMVLADAQAIEVVVKNLLQNALKYAASGKWLRVTVGAARTGKQREVQVTVADHGPGIAARDLPRLFEPFYRSAQVLASPTPGAGLGLSIVQKHAEAHRGRVTVNSSDGQGAAFTLHLPALDGTQNGDDAKSGE